MCLVNHLRVIWHFVNVNAKVVLEPQRSIVCHGEAAFLYWETGFVHIEVVIGISWAKQIVHEVGPSCLAATFICKLLIILHRSNAIFYQ